MLVLCSVTTNAEIRHGFATALRRVVVASPYLDMVREAEQLASRSIEVFGAAAREIAARRANVRMENGVAAKNVI